MFLGVCVYLALYTRICHYSKCLNQIEPILLHGHNTLNTEIESLWNNNIVPSNV